MFRFLYNFDLKHQQGRYELNLYRMHQRNTVANGFSFDCTASNWPVKITELIGDNVFLQRICNIHKLSMRGFLVFLDIFIYHLILIVNFYTSFLHITLPVCVFTLLEVLCLGIKFRLQFSLCYGAVKLWEHFSSNNNE